MAGAGRRAAEQTSASRSNEFPAPAADSPAGANRSSAEQPDPHPSDDSPRAPSSPCQFSVLSFPSTIRPFHSSITLQRRTALANAPLPTGPARARIFIEHAMFRPRHQDQSAALLRDLDLACKVWQT